MNGGEIIALACALIAAAGSIWAGVLTIRGNKDTKQIKGQVVNSHPTDKDSNMRVQLDRIEAVVDDLKDDIGGIREEIRTERKERIAGDQRKAG